jgi:hypothetical protein
MTINLSVYHTQEYRPVTLRFPVLATGNEQWLGDGYYFWQDYEFAKWWGETKKCRNPYRQYSIFKADLNFSEENFIDTVFNQIDYYEFVKKVESFAKRYGRQFGHKPTLEEFNDFIADFGLWKEIKVIRFQDIPENDQLMEVDGYYYKKRIQLRVNDASIITTFAHQKNLYCV